MISPTAQELATTSVAAGVALAPMTSELERDGFAIIMAVLGQAAVLNLAKAIDERLPKAAASAGIRRLVEKVPTVRDLAQSPALRALIEPVLGPRAQLVRSILFNKSDQANWQVGWHQDLSIAVRNRSEVDGYTSWSTKEGVTHVQPLVTVLEQMLIVRLHLDPADESNGALWVSPGSHRIGRLPASEALCTAERLGKHLCAVNGGDVLIFRPLTLHASRKASSVRQRRVVHLEFAGASLPAPLEWAEAEQ